jgi:hypothetical protein
MNHTDFVNMIDTILSQAFEKLAGDRDDWDIATKVMEDVAHLARSLDCHEEARRGQDL